ncbi:MAG TPA: hypothetical protein VFZ55_06320 [Nitrososphaera sp.]
MPSAKRRRREEAHTFLPLAKCILGLDTAELLYNTFKKSLYSLFIYSIAFFFFFSLSSERDRELMQ